MAATTVAGVVLPSAAPLYAQIYPGPNPGSFNEALTDATLVPSFSPAQPVQFEAATFTASVIYGIKPTKKARVVEVAFSNVANLTADSPDDFRIERTSDSRINLDRGTKRPEGGYELHWTWKVTPLRAGDLSLTLRIEPTVLVDGVVMPGLRNVNAPIPINVRVSPIKRAFDEVVTQAKALQVEAPDELVANKKNKVSAQMSLAGHEGAVSAKLGLAQGDGSVPLTINELKESRGAPMRSGVVTSTWEVTPQEKGAVKMQFTAALEAHAGDLALRKQVLRAVDATAEPSIPVRLWASMVALITLLGALVAIMSGLGDALPVLKKSRRFVLDKLHRTPSTGQPK